MASGLASIIGGLAQGITDFGKSAADMFGGAATNNALTVGLDALLNKKSLGQASADARQRQNDYRKWLYDAKTDKDAAAKGLGTALNGAQTALDFIPGVGQSAPVNALQGAIGGLADEFKFNGENYDLGRAAGRAAIGAGANVAAGGLGKALANSGSKVLSNGVLRGAAAGGLSGAISQGGNAAIEGGSADQILQSAAQGAKFGALMGAGTGGVQSLAGALKNARARNNAPALDDKMEIMAAYAPEQKAVADIANGPKTYYHGSPETDITEFDIGRAGRNTRSGEKAIYFTDTPETAEEFAYERIPTESNFIDKAGKHGGVYEVNLDMRNTLDLDNLTDEQIKELWPYASSMGSWQGEDVFARDIKRWRDVKNPQLIKGYLDLEKLANSPYDSFSATMYPNTDNKAKEYGIFDATKAKIIKAPKADNVEVMAERAAPGQLGLFDQTATKAPETGYSQLGLFDQPTQPVTPKTIDVADVNPYAPVNGEVTQTMRDRAADIMTNYKNGLPENELYNRIDPETLPWGYAETREIIDNVEPKDFSKMSFEELLDEVYRDKQNKETFKDTDRYFYEEDMKKARRKAAALGIEVPKSFVPDTEKRLRDHAKYNYRNKIKEQIIDAVTPDGSFMRPEVHDNIENIVPGRDTFRKGFEAAADAALSERLGIAPGNTPKQANSTFDAGTALGRYQHMAGSPGGNIKLRKTSRDLANPEDAMSVIAHERLHSFQNETDNRPIAPTRYDKQVTDAYKQLRDDLKDYYKSAKDIQKRYGKKNVDYWGDNGEQESRMLQQYLENKGYTRSTINAGQRLQYGGTEWGNEINPAFDKFFDKLRELSKKGVALPAILATLGLGGYATQNQEEDENNNGQQI